MKGFGIEAPEGRGEGKLFRCQLRKKFRMRPLLELRLSGNRYDFPYVIFQGPKGALFPVNLPAL